MGLFPERKSRQRALLACLGCILAACATNHASWTDASEPLPVLVRLAPSVNIALTALYGGRIEVRNGCIDLVSGDSSVHTVWPDTYELVVHHGRAVGIRDRRSGQSRRFGQYVKLGGGSWNVDSLTAVEALPPPNCRGESAMTYFPD